MKLLERLDSQHEPQIVERRVSLDGTCKYALRLHDGNLVETVGIPHGDPKDPSRLTVCFSTQVGCAMRCAFCATGRKGFGRNLSADEILWQVILAERDFACHVDTAIAMGQGEPLANYAALAEAVTVLADAEGFGIPASKLAISTCGLPEGIRSLASDELPATLAISLHAAMQQLRDELMPGVRHIPLESLHDELVRYSKGTSRHVVVQYLMLEGVNDGDEDFEALVSFCEGLDVRIVLLGFNHVEGVPFSPSSFGKAALWCHALCRRGINARMNRPRGADIDAACGQLANRILA